MKLSIPVALACALLSHAALALPSTDLVPAHPGDIKVTAIFHASTELDYAGRTILIDPIAAGTYGPMADLVLITHTHPDHFSIPTIARVLKPEGTLILPPVAFAAVSAAQSAGALSKHLKIKVLRNGARARIAWSSRPAVGSLGALRALAVTVKAVPAYNIVRGPNPTVKYHPRGLFNGYVLDLGGDRIYVAGDTEVTPEMKALRGITAAFVPMNLPYTMTPQEAAAGVRAFHPGVVFPYHFRYPFDHPNDNPEKFAAALKGSGIRVSILDWYPDEAVAKSQH